MLGLRRGFPIQARALSPFPARSLSAKKTVTDLKGLGGTRVLVRADLNVPLDKADGVTVTDDTRLRAVVPTLKHLMESDAKVVLCSHFGRPKGQVVDSMRLDPIVPRLSELLGAPVTKVDDCIGADVQQAVNDMADGSVVLLENVRFHAGEEKNDPAFANELASVAEVFVNDAFGTAHRAHASTAGVTPHMRECAGGFLMEKELKFLKGAVDNPVQPMAAVVGGAKVSTKIPVLRSLFDKCDRVIVGGGMIFTFYKAMGLNVGASLIEEDLVQTAAELIEEAEAKGVNLILPDSVVVAEAFDKDAAHKEVPKEGIPDGWMGLDIGAQGVAQIEAALADAQTIVWNGPMGVFEMPAFAKGTLAVAEALAARTAAGATTIIGGGDSVAAVEQAGLAAQMSHISTGGGASLELLEGKVLPGVAALDDA